MTEGLEPSQTSIQTKLAEIDQSQLSLAKPPFAHPRTRDFLQAVIAEGGAIIPQGLKDEPQRVELELVNKT